VFFKPAVNPQVPGCTGNRPGAILPYKTATMSNFKIVPISRETAQQIRETKKDNYGNDVVIQVAKGKGPCRVSLQPFEKGKDRRILFAYSPFDGPGLYAETGPVFINAEPVEPYQDIYRFPPAVKADKESFPLTLIGYDVRGFMVYTQLVGNDDVDKLIEKIFTENSRVHYLHARNAEACCFICKIERI